MINEVSMAEVYHNDFNLLSNGSEKKDVRVQVCRENKNILNVRNTEMYINLERTRT